MPSFCSIIKTPHHSTCTLGCSRRWKNVTFPVGSCQAEDSTQATSNSYPSKPSLLPSSVLLYSHRGKVDAGCRQGAPEGEKEDILKSLSSLLYYYLIGTLTGKSNARVTHRDTYILLSRMKLRCRLCILCLECSCALLSTGEVHP